MKAEFKDKYLVIIDITNELRDKIIAEMHEMTDCYYKAETCELLVYYTKWSVASVIATIVNIKEEYDGNMSR